jgi:hypothetical protein
LWELRFGFETWNAGGVGFEREGVGELEVGVRVGVRMDSELRWEGGRWVYGLQMLTCAGLLYYRSVAAPKVAAVDKAAVRLPVSFLAFQRTFLAVFFLASGSHPSKNRTKNHSVQKPSSHFSSPLPPFFRVCSTELWTELWGVQWLMRCRLCTAKLCTRATD